MKKLNYTLSILLLLIVFSCDNETPGTNNYLLENGYNGNVKSIKSIVYKGLIKKKDKWQINEDSITNIKLLNFDKTGNLIDSEEYIANNGIYSLLSTKYKYISGKIAYYTTYNNAKLCYNEGFYQYEDESNYKEHILSNDFINEKTFSYKLNSNNRVISGSEVIRHFEKDSIFFNETFTNIFNDKKELIETIFYDEIKKSERIVLIQDVKKDNHGNSIQFSKVDKASNRLIEFIVNEFIYY